MTSKTTTEFRKEVWLIVKQQKIVRLTGRLRITIAIYPKSANRQDIDNRIKPTLDALTLAGVWSDDSQVDFVSAERLERVAGGKMIVRISENTSPP